MCSTVSVIRALDSRGEQYANVERLDVAGAYSTAAFNRWFWTADGHPRPECERDALSREQLNADLAADGIAWRLPEVQAQLPSWLRTVTG